MDYCFCHLNIWRYEDNSQCIAVWRIMVLSALFNSCQYKVEENYLDCYLQNRTVCRKTQIASYSKYRSFVFLCRSCTYKPLCWCFCWGSSWGRCSSASWGLQRWRYPSGYTSIVFMLRECVSDTFAVLGYNRLWESLYQLRRPTRILVIRVTISA